MTMYEVYLNIIRHTFEDRLLNLNMAGNIPKDNLIQRRQKLASMLNTDSIFICYSANIFNSETKGFSDSSLWYFTSIKQSNVIYIITKDPKDQSKEYIFAEKADENERKFSDLNINFDAISDLTAIENVLDIHEFDKEIIGLLAGKKEIYLNFNSIRQNTNINRLINDVVFHPDNYKFKQISLISSLQIISSIRNIKEKWEIEQLQKAIEISINGHKEGLKSVLLEMSKNKISNENSFNVSFNNIVNINQTEISYEPIIAFANNGNIIHYSTNSDIIKDAGLLLVDAGARFNYYCADITRTYPISGKFNESEKEIYELVLKAHNQVIISIESGKLNSFKDCENTVLDVFIEGFNKLEILDNQLERGEKIKIIRKHYPHSFGHSLGLDTHDLSCYNLKKTGPKLDNILKENMVFTIEPGLYFDKDDESIDKKYRGIAIRVENDVYITKNKDNQAGFNVNILTKNLPYETADIEEYIKSLIDNI